MKILMVTRQYPWPADAGDLLYTKDLIEGLARREDLELTVYYGTSQENVVQDSSLKVNNVMSDVKKTGAIWSVFSKYPKAIYTSLSGCDVDNIAKILKTEKYDFLLLNETSTSRVIYELPRLLEGCEYPQVVYISHNVDYILRPHAAKEESSLIKRILMMYDAYKYKKSEMYMIEQCDLMTAISDMDRLQYQSDFPSKLILELPPGYTGESISERSITSAVPKLIVLVGSFLWHVKKKNLLEILDRFSSIHNSGVKLRIAGRMDQELYEYCIKEYPTVEYVPNFTDLSDVLCDARMALVLERIGGGFKLKTLDYVFHRVPIVAYEQAISGSGFTVDDCYIVDSLDAAYETVINNIDLLDILNMKQNKAYEKAISSFSWDDRCEVLMNFFERNSND